MTHRRVADLRVHRGNVQRVSDRDEWRTDHHVERALPRFEREVAREEHDKGAHDVRRDGAELEVDGSLVRVDGLDDGRL